MCKTKKCKDCLLYPVYPVFSFFDNLFWGEDILAGLAGEKRVILKMIFFKHLGTKPIIVAQNPVHPLHNL